MPRDTIPIDLVDPFDKTTVIAFLHSIDEQLDTDSVHTCLGQRILKHSFPGARCTFGAWSGFVEFPHSEFSSKFSAPAWFHPGEGIPPDGSAYRFTEHGRHSHDIANFIEALPAGTTPRQPS